MFVRQMIAPGVLLGVAMILNSCTLFSKEVKLEDVSPATVNIENTGDDVEEWGLETEDESYYWMRLGSSQCSF